MNKTIIFSDNSLWGCLNFRGYIINYFVAQGCKVVVVAPNDSFVTIDVPQNIVYEPIEMQRTGSNPLKDLTYMLRLRKIYKKHNPDLVFHYTIKPNIFGTFAAKMLGVRSVCVVTGLGYVFNSAGRTAKVARQLYAQALKYAYRILFLNSDNYNMLVELKTADPKKSMLLLGGEGVEVQQFDCPPLETDGKVIFLMIGRVLYDKGYTEYVEAARANPSAEFWLIGATDTNPVAVPKEVVEQENAIRYLGFMDKKRVFEHIKKASCIVLPSYHEGMSITLVEAIAMGRPIICTDIAGCRETVDLGVNGFLVPVKDGAALANVCRKFLTLSAEQRAEMGRNSRAKAEKEFDIELVLNIYKEIVDERN